MDRPAREAPGLELAWPEIIGAGELRKGGRLGATADEQYGLAGAGFVRARELEMVARRISRAPGEDRDGDIAPVIEKRGCDLAIYRHDGAEGLSRVLGVGDGFAHRGGELTVSERADKGIARAG